jgi:proteasome lid subunit RPN8/RPN11
MAARFTLSARPLACTASLKEGLEQHVRGAFPQEGCGFLIGREEGEGWRLLRVVPSVNKAANPAKNFEIDVRQHAILQRELRAEGLTILGIYHSHPGGKAEPSRQDRERAAMLPALLWWIVGLTETGLHHAVYWWDEAQQDFTRVEPTPCM